MSQTDPIAYCEARVAPRGSSLYYSLWHVPSQARAALLSLYAFSYEINQILLTIHDETVARSKLQWWRIEVERILSGQATHPVGIALTMTLKDYSLPRQALSEFVDNMEWQLEQKLYPDWTALERYYDETSAIERLTWQILSPSTSETAALKLYLTLHIIQDLRTFRAHVKQGRLPLSQTDLQGQGVEEQTLWQLQMTEPLRHVSQQQADRARTTIREGLAMLDKTERRLLRPTLILGRIHFALLAEIESDGFNVLTHQLSLTPLRKLCIAWCSRYFGE